MRITMSSHQYQSGFPCIPEENFEKTSTDKSLTYMDVYSNILGVLYKNHLFLTVLETENFNIKVLTYLVSGESCFLVHRQ